MEIDPKESFVRRQKSQARTFYIYFKCRSWACNWLACIFIGKISFGFETIMYFIGFRHYFFTFLVRIYWNRSLVFC